MRCTTPHKVWKHFQENPLSHSEAHYMMAILNTQRKTGVTRASEIAKELNISAPSVSQTIKTLLKKNWIEQNPDKTIFIPDEKIQIIQQIEQNKALLMDLLVNFLGMSQEQADEDSCKMEHLLSFEFSQKLKEYILDQRQKHNIPIR